MADKSKSSASSNGATKKGSRKPLTLEMFSDGGKQNVALYHKFICKI
jgi:hypothetical protein